MSTVRTQQDLSNIEHSALTRQALKMPSNPEVVSATADDPLCARDPGIILRVQPHEHLPRGLLGPSKIPQRRDNVAFELLFSQVQGPSPDGNLRQELHIQN